MASRRKPRITEDSIFYRPKNKRGLSAKAPILQPSSISNFPQIFKSGYGSGAYQRRRKAR